MPRRGRDACGYELAQIGATLANDGVQPITGQRILAHETVRTVLSAMVTAGMAARKSAENRLLLVAEARDLMLGALKMHPSGDYGWWFLAEIHLMEGKPQAAAQRALLENPAWRHLSAANRQGLGVSAGLLDALLQVDSFQRVWTRLASATETAAE